MKVEWDIMKSWNLENTSRICRHSCGRVGITKGTQDMETPKNIFGVDKWEEIVPEIVNE